MWVTMRLMDEPTPQEHLAEVLFDKPLWEWVADARSTGKSWERIATDLHIATDGKVVYTGYSLNRRYSDKIDAHNAA